jgi:ubiquitin carboxyl-terminal hydrolase 4/11/15
MFGRITGNLFGGSDKGDDDEREGRSKSNGQGSSSRAESPVAGASTSQAPQLVVRPGEAIFVEWSPKMYYEFIDESALRATSTIVDPLIEKEKQRRAAGKAISLEECLDEFSKEETLGQDDLWYCPVCKKHQAATKKLDIYKAPDILVICIKRFGSSRRLSDKLDNLVNFPLEGLDLGERVGERRVAKALGFSKQKGQEYGMDLDWDELPPTEITAEGEGNMVYDLYAVDNHFGGLGGGHYTAFCKNREDGQWWNYDDSRVSKANPEAVQVRRLNIGCGRD